ncbi:MAG: class I SAM-dependent methyltransferase [Egibacteraceae bacterium]
MAVSRMVLWTLYDPPRALLEWRRVVSPGGRIVVIDGLWFATPTGPDAQRPACVSQGVLGLHELAAALRVPCGQLPRGCPPAPGHGLADRRRRARSLRPGRPPRCPVALVGRAVRGRVQFRLPRSQPSSP